MGTIKGVRLRILPVMAVAVVWIFQMNALAKELTGTSKFIICKIHL